MSAPLFLLLSGGLVSFAVLLIEKKDLDGQSQVLSAALEVILFSFVTQFYAYINLILSAPVLILVHVKLDV